MIVMLSVSQCLCVSTYLVQMIGFDVGEWVLSLKLSIAPKMPGIVNCD